MACVGLLLAVGALAAGCGGDEPSPDDAAAVQTMLRSNAEVQRAMAPLYLCLPEEPACYEQAAPAVVDAVERQRGTVEDAVAETDDDCLQEAMGLYRDALVAYGEAGEAASTADVAAVDAALAETTDLEIAYTEKIDGCGFVEGQMAESSAALRSASVGLLRLDPEFSACVDEACVVEVAGRGKELAHEAAVAVDEMLVEARRDERVPSCYPRALEELRRAYRAAERGMQALADLDLATAERELRELTELGPQAQEDLAACIGSAGP